MIRRYTEKDRPSLDKMQFELQKYLSKIDPTRESLAYRDEADAHKYMEKMLSDADKMNGQVLVAEEDGQVIGFAQGVIIEHKKDDDKVYVLSHRPSKEGWIGLLYVAPEYRHHGIGKELMQKMIDYFKIQKCTSVRLLVLSDNKNAISAYQKNGFIGHDLEMVLKI